MKRFLLGAAAVACASMLHASDQYEFTPKSLDCFRLTNEQWDSFNLDGEDSEGFWGSIPLTVCDVIPSDWGSEPAQINGTFGASFKAAYDESSLYMMIYVTDATPSWYNGEVGLTSADNVEVFFSQAERPSADSEERDANGSQLRLHPNYTPNFVSGGRFAGGLIVDGILSGCEYTTKVTEGGYQIEAVIPFDGVIGKDNLKIGEGETVLFDINVADCHETGGDRMNILNWSDDTYNGWKYHSRLGNLNLMGDLVESGISAIDTTEEKATVWYDLLGNRISTPGKGLYIRVENGKATKIAF